MSGLPSEQQDDLSADDRTRLDELFGELVQTLTDGGEVDLEALVGERVDLLPRARELLELARTVAVRRPAEVPTFPGYELLGELGRGGMGRVYRARQLELDRVVALKTLPAQWLTGERAAARFEREARAVARLKHPNIVPIFEVGEAGGVPYFTMEYVEGRTLAGVLDGLRGLGMDTHALRAESVGPEAELGTRAGSSSYVQLVARVVRDVARALHHAHGEGVVHRDVKPSNVLLRPDGTPMLFDFGLAAVDPSAAGAGGDLGEALTLSGEFLGTPHYVSPEQAAGRHLSAATDLFSLGATLYELLTLERPFTGVSTQEILRAVREHEPRHPGRLNSEVPRDLATVCQTAMAKEPHRRYPTAAALAGDLDRFLEGRPVSARAIGPVGRGMRFVRRHPAPSTAALLAVLLLAGTPTALWLQQRAVTDEIQAAYDAAEDSRLEAVAAKEQAEEERDIAREVTAVLEHLFDGITPENGGKDARIFDALEDLAEQVRDLRPAVRAPLERTLGFSYLALTLYDDARTWLEASRNTYASLARPTDAQALELLAVRADLTTLDRHLGDYDRVLAEAIEVRAAYEARGVINADYLHVVGNHADALLSLGRLDEGVAVFEADVAALKAAVGELPTWTLELGLARAWSLVDRRDESVVLLERIHAELLAEHGPDHPDPIGVLGLWAQIEKELGNLDRAAELMDRSLAACLETFGEEALTTITISHNLAGLLLAQGRLDEAEAQEAHAAELAERALPDAHPLQGFIHEVHSTILSKQGRAVEALAAQERSLAVRLELHGEAHPLTIQARLFHGRRLVVLDRLAEAEETLLVGRAAIQDGGEASAVLVRVLHEDLVKLYVGMGDAEREALARADLERILELLGE